MHEHCGKQSMKDTKKTPKTTHHRDTEAQRKASNTKVKRDPLVPRIFVSSWFLWLFLCASVVSSTILCHFECILVLAVPAFSAAHSGPPLSWREARGHREKTRHTVLCAPAELLCDPSCRCIRPLHNHPFLNLPRPARLLWLTLRPQSGIW